MNFIKQIIDWGTGVSAGYICNTAITISKAGAEQRTSLRPSPQRWVEVKFFESCNEASMIINTLIENLFTNMWVPFVQEVFRIENEGSLLGVDTITADMSKLFNFKEIAYPDEQFFTLNDVTKKIGARVYQAAVFDGHSMQLTAPIEDDLDAEKARVYPLFWGYLESYSDVLLTNGHREFSLKFVEAGAGSGGGGGG